MLPSMFNVRVPLDGRDDVFLMNTFTDAQLIVSRDVAEMLDRVARGERHFTGDERGAVETLVENGFIVESRETDHQALDAFFHDLGYTPHPGQLPVHQSKAPRRVLACGVRWGKTRVAAWEVT